MIFFSATAFYDSSFKDDFHVVVDYTGRVEWGFGGDISLLCDLDLTYYPFDSHTCHLELENWAYDNTKVDLHNYTDHVVRSSLRLVENYTIQFSYLYSAK